VPSEAGLGVAVGVAAVGLLGVGAIALAASMSEQQKQEHTDSSEESSSYEIIQDSGPRMLPSSRLNSFNSCYFITCLCKFVHLSLFFIDCSEF
jgi:hypothetical protein